MKNIKMATLDETCENIILNQKLDDVFQFLQSKAEKNSNKTASISFRYLNVLFEINCSLLPETIVPRGFDDVQE